MFKEKVIVITGAAGGIGSATASLFARKGATLVLTDIRVNALEEQKKEFEEINAEPLIVQHDVTDPQSWNSLLDRVKQKYGRIDILINNAGIVEPGLADELPFEKVKQQVSVNLMGTINGCREVLGLMKKQNSGKIVNVASLGGIIPMPGEAVYCATKYAIRGYTFSLNAELKNTPISVSAVCPDSVDTPQLAHELQYDEAVLSFIGSPLKPEKVARGILKAARKNKPEILIPTGMGVLCRIMLAFPAIFFLILPLLKKIGASTIQDKRKTASKM